MFGRQVGLLARGVGRMGRSRQGSRDLQRERGRAEGAIRSAHRAKGVGRREGHTPGGILVAAVGEAGRREQGRRADEEGEAFKRRPYDGERGSSSGRVPPPAIYLVSGQLRPS